MLVCRSRTVLRGSNSYFSLCSVVSRVKSYIKLIFEQHFRLVVTRESNKLED